MLIHSLLCTAHIFWAERSLRAKTRSDQALFGIIQGGVDPQLRVKSTRFISSLDTPGIAIGGLSVGETKAQMYSSLDVIEPYLPVDKPRYLMGVGTPRRPHRGHLPRRRHLRLRPAETASRVIMRPSLPRAVST